MQQYVKIGKAKMAIKWARGTFSGAYAPSEVGIVKNQLFSGAYAPIFQTQYPYCKPVDFFHILFVIAS